MNMIDPLVMIIVFEECFQLSNLTILMVIQQLHSFSVSITRQLEEIVYDTSNNLLIVKKIRYYRTIVTEDDVDNHGNSFVVVTIGQNTEQLANMNFTLTTTDIQNHLNVLLFHMENESECTANILQVNRNKNLNLRIHFLRQRIDESLLQF